MDTAICRTTFPGCPKDRPEVIARHACQKYSGRVGRSAAAKRLDEDAVQLAVAAHVRHAETRYDRLLARGLERWEARDRVRGDVDRVLSRWRGRGREDSARAPMSPRFSSRIHAGPISARAAGPRHPPNCRSCIAAQPQRDLPPHTTLRFRTCAASSSLINAYAFTFG
jgi:hypothetical protein